MLSRGCLLKMPWQRIEYSILCILDASFLKVLQCFYDNKAIEPYGAVVLWTCSATLREPADLHIL